MTPDAILRSIHDYGDLSPIEILQMGRFWLEFSGVALAGVFTALFLYLIIVGYKPRPGARYIAILPFLLANSAFLWGIAFSSVGLLIYKIAPWLWPIGEFLNDYTTLCIFSTIEKLLN